MDELEPCPFCGGKAAAFREAKKSYWYGSCLPCDADGPPCLTEQEAIAAWNTRAAPKAEPVAFDWPRELGDPSIGVRLGSDAGQRQLNATLAAPPARHAEDAIAVSRLIHDECKDVPHDIGMRVIQLLAARQERGT